MKPQFPKNLVRTTMLALCAAGLALSGPTVSQAEQTSSPRTPTYGSGKNYQTAVERKSEGQRAPEAVVPIPPASAPQTTNETKGDQQ
jgi:hypothetical protein